MTSLSEYRRRGGLQAWARSEQMSPQAVIDTIAAAGLRGRGGAGFPTALKWQGLYDSPASRKFVACNAAEGEPGTFKDRTLLRHNPYLVLEGLAIAARTLGAERAYIATKECFTREVQAVTRAYDELASETSVVDNIEVVLGPDLYSFGEERGLLAVIEGGLPFPRTFPPYMQGLFSGAFGGPSADDNNPTAVNNAETLAHVTEILRSGPEAFRAVGTPSTPGTTLFTVSGDVRRPVVVELPFGMTLRELIYVHARGPRHGAVKAVLSGTASEPITDELLSTRIDFDTMRAVGVAPGSGGFVVYDETACMVQVAYIFSQFLAQESCGQCTSCKVISGSITDRLARLLNGEAGAQDLAEVYRMAESVTSGRRCALPVSEQTLICSIIERFEQDFRNHVTNSCALRHDMRLPKILDYAPDAGFRYDEDYAAKHVDWSAGLATVGGRAR